MKYPILDSESERETYPFTGQCPVCGIFFNESGFSFFSAGALLYDHKGNMVIRKIIQMKSYFHIGFHGSENFTTKNNCNESYFSLPIVDFLNKGEFEFNFCSIECMRIWFNTILDDFQRQFKEQFNYEP